jgi:hypothetical protein
MRVLQLEQADARAKAIQLHGLLRLTYAFTVWNTAGIFATVHTALS